MSRCFLILINVLVTYTVLSVAQSGCHIRFPKEDDRLQPVIFNNKTSNFEFALPEDGAISIRTGDPIILSCPNPRNVLEQSNSNITSATCVRGETLRIGNQQHQFDNLQCHLSVKGSIKTTNTKCGNNQGKIIDIGYKVTRREWITLIQVCYDSNQGNALYADHTIYGQAIDHASKQKYRPGFQDAGLASDIKSANNLYKQKSQKELLTNLLGSEDLANQYVQKNYFLARGHLAPDADFLFAGLQFATYFYINACPQWEAVNAGNWLAIENMVRKVAGKRKQPLRIITGSHGVLSLPDLNNNLADVYLDPNGKLPVPKFLWKIVYSPSSKEAIALVALNDPFVRRTSAEHRLCADICSRYGWGSQRWEDIKKGLVYCCDVKELQNVVHTIPKFTISGILRGL